jgi:nucleoside-diphosphate-sugar epimerase
MKITFIGASGFIGTGLIKELKESGHVLQNIDKRQSESFLEITVVSDVLNEERLPSLLSGSDVVVLLAAEHRDDVSPVAKYYEVNVGGLKNTLRAMDVNRLKRLVFISSVAVYGLDKDNPNEGSPADPFNHYGKSKWEAECVLANWYVSHKDWNINVVRPTVVFGEGNRGNVYNLLRQIATGRFLMIGKGDNMKSMAYVGNVVAFIRFLIEQVKKGYNVYNYADKPDMTTQELVVHVETVLNRRIPTIRIPYGLGIFGGYCLDGLAWILRTKLAISSVRVRKFCATTQFDASKAQTSGFTAPYTLSEGLAHTLKTEFLERELE